MKINRAQRSPDQNEGGGNPSPNVNLEVNLDALSSPEGGYNPESFNPTGTIESVDDVPPIDTGSLPNLDAQFNKPAPKTQEQQQQQQQNPNPDNTQKNDSISVDEMNKIYNRMKSKYGDEFELPVDTNAENFLDNVSNFIEESSRYQINPEIQKLNDATRSGVKVEDYIKNYNKANDILELDDKAIVQNVLKSRYGKSEKNPNGWDDVKTEETIKKMENSGYLELEASRIRQEITQQRDGLLDNMTKQSQQELLEQNKNTNIARDNAINQTVEAFNKLDNVYGLPVSQSDKADFSHTLRVMTTPDSKTGISPIVNLLQSDEVLAKVIYTLSKGDDKIREALQAAKEGVKKSWQDKLDPEPRLKQTQGKGNSSEIDFDALAAPAKF